MSFLISIAKRFCQRRRQTRIWSNRELEKFAGLFEGRAINVSGWKDEDRQGRRYRDYFPKIKNYCVSNITGDKGKAGIENEIFLDLEKPLPPALEGRFDVVFCHTTLEHIYYVKQALDNLCLLSKDIVILVVPFLQEQHQGDSFGDYWRFTPQGITRNLSERGFEALYISTTPYRNNPVYVFSVAARDPEKWKAVFSPVKISDGKIKKLGKPPYFCKFLMKHLKR